MFEDKPLPFQAWQFVNPDIGTLSITRLEKGVSNQITFQLQLKANPRWFFDTQWKQKRNSLLHDDYKVEFLMRGEATLVVSDAYGGAPSMVGYSTINFGALTGIRGIFPVHKVMALTGIELGVTNFRVGTIVNNYLREVCQESGMHLVNTSFEGLCTAVYAGSRDGAPRAGWY